MFKSDSLERTVCAEHESCECFNFSLRIHVKPRFPLKPWLKIGLRLKGLGLKAQGFGFAGSRNRAASSRELELKVQGSSDPVWIRAWVAGHPFSDVFF